MGIGVQVFPPSNRPIPFRTSYEVVFNKREAKSRKKRKGGEEDEVDGPVVERKCIKCGHERMSYAALQLRSSGGQIPTSRGIDRIVQILGGSE